MGVSNQVEDTTKTFIAILGLGLVGLLFLIIFGNLSGNLGFTDDAITVPNEVDAYINITEYTLDGASDKGSGNFVITGVWNTSLDNNTLIVASNYEVSSVGVFRNATDNTWLNVNLSYTYTRDSQVDIGTDEVILNLTGGAVTFFGFSNVWFVLLAITLLIIIVISVIAVVSKGGKSNFTS